MVIAPSAALTLVSSMPFVLMSTILPRPLSSTSSLFTAAFATATSALLSITLLLMSKPRSALPCSVSAVTLPEAVTEPASALNDRVSGAVTVLLSSVMLPP